MSDDIISQGEAELAQDRQHGASELARRALELLAQSALQAPADDWPQLQQKLVGYAEALSQARPSMIPIHTLSHRWLQQISQINGSSLMRVRQQAAMEARQLVAESKVATAKVAEEMTRHLKPGMTLITHSFSSTLVEGLSRFRTEDAPHVIFTESRPLYEGYYLADKLSRWEIPATMITEAQLGLFVPQADIALVGADSIDADGALINKAGTLLLALTAHHYQVPLYVAAESYKESTSVKVTDLEEMSPEEIRPSGWPGVTIRNVYFDRTPRELLSMWLHEKGATALG